MYNIYAYHEYEPHMVIGGYKGVINMSFHCRVGYILDGRMYKGKFHVKGPYAKFFMHPTPSKGRG